MAKHEQAATWSQAWETARTSFTFWAFAGALFALISGGWKVYSVPGVLIGVSCVLLVTAIIGAIRGQIVWIPYRREQYLRIAVVAALVIVGSAVLIHLTAGWWRH